MVCKKIGPKSIGRLTGINNELKNSDKGFAYKRFPEISSLSLGENEPTELELILVALGNVCVRGKGVPNYCFRMFQGKRGLFSPRLFLKTLDKHTPHVSYPREYKTFLDKMIHTVKEIKHILMSFSERKSDAKVANSATRDKCVSEVEQTSQFVGKLNDFRSLLKHVQKLKSMMYDFTSFLLYSPEVEKRASFHSGLSYLRETITGSFKSVFLRNKDYWHYTVDDYYQAGIKVLKDALSDLEELVLHRQHDLEEAEKITNQEDREKKFVMSYLRFLRYP